ncbi:MAG: stalk domain-containing protein [Defluviitaleaceae bacterium]|nr:stalk domain-containing protein [Defluviitaleaceae bacterium]
MKKIVLSVMISILSITFAVTAFANQPNLRFNRNEVELSVPLENRNGHTMIEIGSLFDLLDANVTRSNDGRVFTITKNNAAVSLTVGSATVNIGGNLQTLPVAPFLSGENVMVPLTALSEAFGASVAWDNATRTVDIRLSDFDIADVDFVFLNQNSLETRNSTVMDYESVRRTAVNTNRQIEDLSYNLRDLTKMMDDFEDDFRDINDALWRSRNSLMQTSHMLNQMSTLGHDIGDLLEAENWLESGVESAIRAISEMVAGEITASNALRSRRETEQMIADASEFMVLTYLTNINNNAMDLQLLELRAVQSERNRDFTSLRRDLGMASDENLRTAELSLRQDRASLTALNSALQTERENLNRMLRFPISRDLVVTFEPEIVPVYVQNINDHARRIIADDVNIRSRRVEAEAARARLSSLRNLGGEVRSADERALRDTINAYDRAVEELDRNIRNTYNTLKQLEERHDILMTDLVTANNQYRISTANFEIGNITEYDLYMVRMAVLNAEIAIVRNTFQHYNLRFLFERPHLLG